MIVRRMQRMPLVLIMQIKSRRIDFMKLQRKLFVKPDYYEGLNEAEAEWLKNKRKEIARNTLKKRKDLRDQKNLKNLVN